MIANFARAFRAPRRALTDEDAREHGPPEAFVEALPEEGGVTYVAPMIDALRHVLRRARSSPSAPSTAAPEQANLPEPRERS